MEWIELGELTNIELGKTPARKNLKYWNGDYTWVSIADLKEKYISSSKEKISDVSLEETNIKIVPKGTVIMSFKLSIGKRAITEKDLYTNEAIAAFHIKNNDILNFEYLYYVLGFVDLIKDTDKAVMGKTLNKAKLIRIKIPVPPIKIQKQIVEVLDQAQSLIDNRKEQIKLLDDLIESVFYNMFGDPVKNDRGWDVKKLEENLIFIKYGVSTPPNFAEEGKYFIRATNIDNGKISNDSMKFIGINEQSRLDNYKLHLGYLLIVRSGVNAGDSAYVTSEHVGGYAGYDLFLDLNEKELDYIFTGHLFQSNFKDKVIKPLTRRAAQPHINATQVKEMKIIIPPIQMQNQFAEEVQQIESQKQLLEDSLKLMEDNYNSLMQRAFKGELF